MTKTDQTKISGTVVGDIKLLPAPSDFITLEQRQKGQIRDLNDLARTAMGVAGRLTMTANLVGSLEPWQLSALREKVETYDHWEPENDAYEEHDFGTIYGMRKGTSIAWTDKPPVDTDKIPFKGITVFFKIDVFDKKLEYGSEEPWNPKKSTRVLTLMLAEDY